MNSKKDMTLWDHLEMLRGVLFKILATLVLTTALGFLFTPLLYQALLFPVRNHLSEGGLKAQFSAADDSGPEPQTLPTAAPERLQRLESEPDLPAAERQAIQTAILRDLLRQVQQLAEQQQASGGIQIIYASPIEPFTVKLKIAFLGGVVFAIPFICFFLWGFVRPALKQEEKGLMLKSGTVATLLFCIGALFGYGFLPLGIPALLKFSAPGVGHIWPLPYYMSFCTRLILAFGLVFEMPLVLGILGRLGLVDADWLARGRPYAVIAIAFLAAFLTPPDVISQIALGIPMLLLYEISIRVVKRQSPVRPSL